MNSYPSINSKWDLIKLAKILACVCHRFSKDRFYHWTQTIIGSHKYKTLGSNDSGMSLKNP